MQIPNEEVRKGLFHDWYWKKGEETTNKAIHYEICKHCRPRSHDFLGEEKGDRFNHLGKFNAFRKKIKSKFGHHIDNPLWDYYCSVEYVQHTNRISRDHFVEEMDSRKTLSELAEKWKTRIQTLENKEDARVPDPVYLPADLKNYWTDYLYNGAPFDLVFDVDGDKLTDSEDIHDVVAAAHGEAKKIKEFFEQYDAPFFVSFSGGRGFHLGIMREHIEEHVSSESFAEFGGAFAEWVAEETGAEFDMSIYTDKRIFRVPYTLHSSTGLVCLPLTNEQFEDFELKMAYPLRVRSQLNIRDRGLRERGGRAVRIINDFHQSDRGSQFI